MAYLTTKMYAGARPIADDTGLRSSANGMVVARRLSDDTK